MAGPSSTQDSQDALEASTDETRWREAQKRLPRTTLSSPRMTPDAQRQRKIANPDLVRRTGCTEGICTEK
jgi:hypothetical protein